jgi:ribosomal protein L37AE/L43A
MTNCPCCSNQMLRHIRTNQTYWFCRHCWQAMPTLARTQRSDAFEMGVYSFKESAKIWESSFQLTLQTG